MEISEHLLLMFLVPRKSQDPKKRPCPDRMHRPEQEKDE